MSGVFVREVLRALALSVGSFRIFVGIARGALVAHGAGGMVAGQILGHAPLGLGLPVGVTIPNLVLNPTLTAAATTAATIVVRELLTCSLGLARGA